MEAGGDDRSQGSEVGVTVVYLAHPAGASTKEEHLANRARAKRWFRWAAEQGVAVVADWIIYCEIWDDFRPKQRVAGLAHDDAHIACCHAFWAVGGRWSSGMLRGRETARRAGIPVVDLTYLGEEPPEWQTHKRLERIEQKGTT